jgi:D-aminoacyl-tRNA deacylase
LLDLRVFEDQAGKMNLSVREVAGAGVLLVPNFTLAGDSRKGRRPSFDRAMKPERAEGMFAALVERVRTAAGPAINVQAGVFRTHMRVTLVNDGPVTLMIDSAAR